MAQYRYIYWRDDGKRDASGNRFANIHFLVGYNQRSIDDYRKMAEEVRETFPGVGDEDLICGSVTQSSFCKGFTLIALNTHIPEGKYEGWHQTDRGPDYQWV